MANNAADWKVGAILRTILLDAGIVDDDLGMRFYPLQAPQGAVLPYAVYRKVSDVKNPTKSGVGDIAQIRMQIDLYDDSYTRGAEVNAKILNALDGQAGTWEGCLVDGIKYLDSTDLLVDGETFMQWSSDYQVRIARFSI